MHLLDKRTVLVHGLALTPKANRPPATNVVLHYCLPNIQLFLFSKTLSGEQLSSVSGLHWRSSPITGKGDLLDEIQYVRSKLGTERKLIYKMVTPNAADMLRLEYGSGQFKESGVDP